MSNIPKQNNDSSGPVKEFFNNYFNDTISFPSNDVDAVQDILNLEDLKELQVYQQQQ